MDSDPNRDAKPANALPPLPFRLQEHKLSIAIYWTLMVVTSGVLPIVGYFALRYTTSLSLGAIFGIFLGLTAVMSGYSLVQRTWRLARKGSDCRPLGGTSGWAQDFFNWNFLSGFVSLTALLSVGSSVINYPTVSLPIAVLLLYVCLELLLVQMLKVFDVRLPFAISSVAAGQPLRSGSYAVVEDIFAVDGGGNQAYRLAWSQRYEASSTLRSFLDRMDLLWGTTGLVITAPAFGVVFGVANRDVGYAIGWGLPWVWAGGMAYLTIRMTQRMLEAESSAVDCIATPSQPASCRQHSKLAFTAMSETHNTHQTCRTHSCSFSR